MSYLRFNHVFFALMGLALVSAFVLPVQAGDRVRAQVQNLFAPVSWPVNRLAGWVHSTVAGQPLRDDGSGKHPRSSAELLEENQRLRIEVASLSGQLQRIAVLESERARLGEVRAFCTPFSVIGADAGPRQSLLIAGSSLDGLRSEMPVVYTGGIVGRIVSVGVGGARVLLITDRQFKPITAAFARFSSGPDGSPQFQRLSAELVLVEGAGDGTMLIRNIPQKKIEEVGIRTDDWVVLSDRDWPIVLDGYRLGRVEKITPSKSPGFAEIRVVPDQSLMTLREVMVMNRDKG